MQILRTIAIIALFYYGFKFLAKTVFPWFLKRWLNKRMGQFNSSGFQDQQQAKEFSKKHEGEVKIKTTAEKQTSETKDLGDFIDYEEVE